MFTLVPLPTSEVTEISPACDSMMFRQMANPSPVPRLFPERKERFKDVKQVIGGNPAALVRHPRADAGLVASREFRRQNADSSLLLRGFDRILNDVQEDLFDLIAVRLEGRKARRQPAGDHEMFLLKYRLKQFESFVHHIGQTEPDRG